MDNYNDRKVGVAGLNVNSLSKTELLSIITERIKSNQKTFLTTLYSEFLYNALRDKEVMSMLNKADIAIVDGIGIMWAEYFLSRPTSFKNKFLGSVQIWWQMVYTGASIILHPSRLRKVFREKIVGADLFWDLSYLASNENFSIFLLGWENQQCEKVAQVLQARYPKINIVGYANTNPNDEKVLDYINQLKPDMVFVAFGRLKQEFWITKNQNQLNAKFFVGLGGSFDYAIGKESHPPKWVRSIGIEWLYRLVTQSFTQKGRVKRIYQGVIGLIFLLVNYKISKNYN